MRLSQLFRYGSMAALAGIIALSCAGPSPEVRMQRSRAKSDLSGNDFSGAMAHIDSAATFCETGRCVREGYTWLLEEARLRSNEFLRSRAHQEIILSYLREYPAEEEALKSAYLEAEEYYEWAESLYLKRGDPLPYADAALLFGSVARVDSPAVAVDKLVLLLAAGETAPPAVANRIGRARSLLDGIAAEMPAKLESAESDTLEPGKTRDNLRYAYHAAVAFDNKTVASRAAGEMVELYKKSEESDSAAVWTGRLLRIRGEIEESKTPEKD